LKPFCSESVFPFVLYGYETWTLTLREESRLRILENMLLRKLFGHRKEGLASGWEKTEY
jgi:hypothetical protein